MAEKSKERSKVLQILGSWTLKIRISKHRSRKRKKRKRKDSAYGQATKDTVREEAVRVTEVE